MPDAIPLTRAINKSSAVDQQIQTQIKRDTPLLHNQIMRSGNLLPPQKTFFAAHPFLLINH
ncbi:hypothetical protein [Thalassotalea fusca]